MTVPGARDRLSNDPAAAGHVRFPACDGLRALAATAVLVLHVAAFTGTRGVVGDLARHGDVGVPIFFALSGFLLYRPYVAVHAFRAPAKAAGGFYVKRFLRVFPAYWLVLTVSILVFQTVSVDGLRDFLGHYLLLDSYSSTRAATGIVQTWSLATEIAFYAVLPVYAAVLAGLTHRRSRPWATELVACAVLGVTGLAVYGWLMVTRESGTVAVAWLPAQLQFFALGMATAVVSTRGDGRVGRALGRAPALSWGVAGIAYLVCAFALPLSDDPFVDPSAPGAMVMQQVLYGLIAMALLGPCVFGTAAGGAIRGVLTSRPVRYVGLVSYGIFLWHVDWLKQLAKWGALDWFPSFEFSSGLVMTFALSLATATLSWRLLEEPLQRAGRRWLRRVGSTP